MATTKKIKLNDLLVNTENYRFDQVASQKEAIDKLVDDQADKLHNLAQHILHYGFNPNDKIQVVASSSDAHKYIVLEGNRRTVATKLIHNPDLIDSSKHASLKKKFKKLHESKSKHPSELECTVYDSPTEADVWIKIKHTGQSEGIGTVAWNAQQVDRFEAKVEGKSSIALQTVKILENSDDVPRDIKNGLKNLKISNLDRLVSDPDVRGFLGIEISNGIIQSSIEKREVVRGLAKIAKDLLDPKFNVKKIYTKNDRRAYIEKFPATSKPNINKRADKPWQFDGSTTSTPSKPSVKPKPNPKDRTTLIPKSCVMKISNQKVNNIYHELLKLDITKYTNAGAVLFRVFVELSVDTYLEKHTLVATPSAAKSGVSFQPKMYVVINHMENKRFADAGICKGIKNAIKDNNDILGIDTWHAYVHNNRFSPKANLLITTWDNMQDFMVILWDNIK